MPASTFKSPPFIILSGTKEHHPQAGHWVRVWMILHDNVSVCRRVGQPIPGGHPSPLTCKVFMSACALDSSHWGYRPPALPLRCSYKDCQCDYFVCCFHVMMDTTESGLTILVMWLGPLRLPLHVTLGVLINITPAGCWVRLWCQQCVYLFGPDGETRLRRLNQNNAQSLQMIMQRQLWQELRAWNIDIARGKVFVASCWMSSSCSWMFSMKYEKIVGRFHKSKITYNLCSHLWFVCAPLWVRL